FCFLVDLTEDGPHELLALVAHYGGKARGAEHTPKGGFEQGPEGRFGASLVGDALEEQQGVDDLVTRKGINHEPLLIGSDHLLRSRVDVEDALVEEHDVLNERDLILQTRLGDDALGPAEFEKQRLLRLTDGEQRQIGKQGRNAEKDQAQGEGCAVHGWPSGGVGAFLVNSESGRNGTTPGAPLCPRVTFSGSPSTFSMVSMKIR